MGLRLLTYYSLGLTTLCLIVGLKSVDTKLELVTPLLLIPMWWFLLGEIQGKKRNLLRLALLIYSMGLSLVLAISGILIIKKWQDLGLAMFLLPLPAYFFLARKTEAVTKVVKAKQVEVDESKREFVKTITGTLAAGLAIWFMSKKKVAQAAFFGGGGGTTLAMKDTAGIKIDPAQRQPLDGYNISDMDTAGTTKYYGFLNKNGGWYIMKENTTTNSFSYRKGAADYDTGWSDRTSPGGYANFYNTFRN